MRLYPLLLLLLSLLVVSSATESKLQRKTLRKVKALKKSSTKSSNATQEQAKSASYHVPILVSAPSPHDIPPVSVEVRDEAHSPSDYHPIQPIHLVARPSHHHQREYVYQGPVAVPLDYPYGREQQASNDYEIHNRVSPGEYYSESYHGDLSAIPGIPGQDYPTYVDLPHTGFKCMQHTSTPGFYADVETRCQMWHYCQPDGRHDKFLCPNGTIFDQMTRVCNWWFNVHCDSSLSHYDINFDLYREPLRLSAASVHKAVENSIAPPPNSFLSHLENFEARSEYAPPIQSAAASQPVHRYPAKMAPAPQVRHDPDTYVDSSNAHTLATPVVSHSHSKTTPLFAETGHAFVKAADNDSPFGVYRARSVAKSSDLKLQDVDKQRLKKRKRISRRKLRKLKGKHDKEDDDIPTYREPKATPAARRYRVVRRRKVNKQYQ